VSSSAAIAIIGHKTEAIYRRYALVDPVAASRSGHEVGPRGER
jgi:hypothetical protein